MRQPRIHGMGILLLSMMVFISGAVSAEIYKWVDADGKVHFGDKPLDPKAASNAQPVELGSSYQPAERTAQEQEAYDAEQRNNMLREQVRRREEQQAQEKASAQRLAEQAKRCAGYADAIEKLDTVEVKNGVRYFTYLKDQDGKSVSSERQRQIVDDLKVKMRAAGCN